VLGHLSPARRRFVLLCLAAALLTALTLAGAAVTRLASGRLQPVAPDVPGPVLLVSGYGGSTRVLDPLRKALTARGRHVVVVAPVRSGTGDIAEQARALADAAAAARARFHAGSVDVVGYSAGGVAAREWVRHDGGSTVARRVLSIGSPHHGTALAELVVGLAGRCPTACRQLEPGSALLRSLNAGDETPAGPVFVSVWSRADRTVVPPASAHLDGALDLTVQSVCPGRRTAHSGLPRDPVVLALLASALGPGRPHAPRVTGCAGAG
jgi:pimeloyl-ACP methyl ester carboxylesterase